MKIVYLNYFCTLKINQPKDWLQKIKPITGVAEALSKKHSITCIEQINYTGIYTSNAVEYLFIKPKRNKNWLPFKIHTTVKQLQPDVVIIHGTVFPLQSILLRLCLGKRVKIIIQHHAENPFNGWRKKLQLLASFFVNAYFFPAKEVGLEWIKNGNISNNKKVYTILEGSSYFKTINKQTAIKKTNVSGKPIFLWAGRLDGNKNPLLIINAFIQFLHIYPFAKLYFIHYTNDLLNEIQAILDINHHYKKQIILVGKLPHYDMEFWFNSADFIISTSYKEGTSMVISEAMSCGCIPILTNIPSFKKMTNNTCGFLFNSGNQEQLLNFLIKTINMDIEIERHKVLIQFNNHLSFEAIATSIEMAINEI